MDTPKTFNSILRNSTLPELEQINENNRRYYITPDNKRYPSISTVTGWKSRGAIQEWRKRVGEEEANKVSRKATNIGTIFHGVCERYLQNHEVLYHKSKPTPNDYIIPEMFKKTKNKLDLIDNIHCQETRLYSNHLGVAGTTDCIAEYIKKLSVIDFKSARKIKKKEYIDHYFMQAAGYAVMYEERTGIPVPQIVIVMTSTEDDHECEVFIEKRDNYIDNLINLIEQYKISNAIP